MWMLSCKIASKEYRLILIYHFPPGILSSFKTATILCYSHSYPTSSSCLVGNLYILSCYSIWTNTPFWNTVSKTTLTYRHRNPDLFSFWLFQAPIQSEENPRGQNGCVIFEGRSYRLSLLDANIEDHSHQNSVHLESLRVMQETIFKINLAFKVKVKTAIMYFLSVKSHWTHMILITFLQAPIQCVENPRGQNGCVIFEDRSYRRPLLDANIEDDGHQNSVHPESLRVMQETIFKINIASSLLGYLYLLPDFCILRDTKWQKIVS